MKISKMRKKIYDRQQFLPRSAKKSGELCSTNNKVRHVSLDPPKSISSEDHIYIISKDIYHFERPFISAPTGSGRHKFLHALENDQGLLAHTPCTREGVPNNF